MHIQDLVVSISLTPDIYIYIYNMCTVYVYVICLYVWESRSVLQWSLAVNFVTNGKGEQSYCDHVIRVPQKQSQLKLLGSCGPIACLVIRIGASILAER